MKQFIVIKGDGDVIQGQSCCIVHTAENFPDAKQIIQVSDDEDDEDTFWDDFLTNIIKSAKKKEHPLGKLDKVHAINVTEPMLLLVKLIKLKKMKESKHPALVATYDELKPSVWEQAETWLEENPQLNIPDAILWKK